MNKIIEFFDGDFTFVIFILLIIASVVIKKLFDLFKAFVCDSVIPYFKSKIVKIRQRKANNRKAKLSYAIDEAVSKVIEQDKHKKANSDWNELSELYARSNWYE